MSDTPAHRHWHDHHGPRVAAANGFEVIACQPCGFKHIIAIPTVEALEQIYRHEYYLQEKPFYIERYLEDRDWWNGVYAQRYEVLERHLPDTQRRILDIGSGPGLFLRVGQQRGWQAMGIEPSTQAGDHCRSDGLDVVSGLFSETTAEDLGTFDAVNMSLVLEHIPDPAAFLRLVHRRLHDHGLLCIVVPNDFNPFQEVLQRHLGFHPWWVAPPHHINYFDGRSLAHLVDRCGFAVLEQQATFPIDLFLLMGDNYIGNDEVGRACHKKRMQLERALLDSGQGAVLAGLQTAFASQGLGREVVLFAKKRSVEPA
jgi:SAM-dependent methyltransferase